MAKTAIGTVGAVVLVFICMAGDTLRGCAFIDSIPMATGAGKLCVMPHERKRCVVVIEGHICPSAGDMTRGAIRSKLTVVLVSRGVACITGLGCALVYAVHMAGRTQHSRVQTSQRETCVIVIEGDIRPFGGLMTGRAVRSKLAVVYIFCGMAGIAGLWRSLVSIVHMTRRAQNRGMGADQRKRCVGVVERCALPRSGVVAGSTVRSKLSHVLVLRGMAGITISRRAFINSVDMTGRAKNRSMRTVQREGGLRMVEVDVLP